MSVDTGDEQNAEPIMNFLAQMPLLNFLKLGTTSPIDYTNVLHSSLTHLYICNMKLPLTLPVDPSCYSNLEVAVIDCHDFVFQEGLARALAQAENLRSLVLNINYCDVAALCTLVKSSKSLSVLYITTSLNSDLDGDNDCGRLDLEAKSLVRSAKANGRIIDIQMFVRVFLYGMTMFEINTATWFQ